MKEFAFDYSYWSHDGYDEDPSNGFMSPQPGSNYADQNKVFQDLVRISCADLISGSRGAEQRL